VPVTSSLFDAVLFQRYADDDDTPEERERAIQATRAELDMGTESPALPAEPLQGLVRRRR
jgi:hypothetical protein